MKYLLVAIDTTEGFCKPGNPLYVGGAEKVGPALNAFMDKIRYGSPRPSIKGILATNDTHFKIEYPYSPEAAVFPYHQGWGTDEQKYTFDIHRILDFPIYQLFKNKFDMWAESSEIGVPIGPIAFETDAERFAYDTLFQVFWYQYDNQNPKQGRMLRNDFVAMLKESGIDTLVFTGVATDYCVYCGIAGALANGFNAILLEDLCAGIFVPSIPGGTGRYDTETYQGAANLDDLIENRPLLKQAQAEGRFKVMSSTEFLNL